MADTERDMQQNTRRGEQRAWRASAVSNGMRTVVRQTFAVTGACLIAVGVPIAVLTPFPFVPIGLPVVILGVVLLGRNSLWGRNWMESVLARHPKVEKYAPNWLMKLVFGRDKQA